MWLSFIGFSHSTKKKKGPELSRGRNLIKSRAFCAAQFITCQFTAACARCAGGQDKGTYVTLRWPAVFPQSYDCKAWVFIFKGEFSPIVESCERHTERSPSGLVALRSSCGAVCARALALLLERQLVDWRLAEWLTSGWGASWWSCQACCVAFSWQRFSWRTQKRIKMQLPLSSVQNFYFPPTGSATPFIFRDRPGKRNDDGNTWPRSLQKKHFGKVCERGRKRPNFSLSREKIRATRSAVAASYLALDRLIGWDYLRHPSCQETGTASPTAVAVRLQWYNVQCTHSWSLLSQSLVSTHTGMWSEWSLDCSNLTH